MWKAQAGIQINMKEAAQSKDDDWETDPDFVNDVTEVEQRWGSSTIEGSGRTAGAINMDQLRRETEQADALKKKKELIDGPNSSFGYGGKFGVQQDRMDVSAVGHDYVGKVENHASQKDYSAGFGGKYGVQSDRVDKSAVTWEHKEKVEKHASQKDYSSGFGGKFGIQADRQDKSAMGWDHVEKLEKHESQKDYSKGFGGKYGVQTDRQDKSAVGWDHHEAAQKHESQTDHKIGFGGKFGVQTDRMDKSAAAFGDEPAAVGTNYCKTKPDIGSAKPSELRARFENLKTEEISRASQPVSVSKSNVQSRTAAFNSPPMDSVADRKPKQLDETSGASPLISKSNVQSRTAEFSSAIVEPQSSVADRKPKQLDESKMAFLQQSNEPDAIKNVPRQLDQSKLSHFTGQKSTGDNTTTSQIQGELEQLRQMQQQKIKVDSSAEVEEREIYQNVGEIQKELQETCDIPNTVEVPPEDLQDEIADTGLSAIAVYDYQAGAEDEISFDPDDIITHVEKIDEGWWRGLCKGKYGLFPANYVQLQ